MKNILKILYGNLSIRNKVDYVLLPLKVLYILYSIPFLLFAFLLMAKSFGAFGSSKEEKIGIAKKILVHISAIFWSYCLWISTYAILEDTLGIKIAFHILT